MANLPKIQPGWNATTALGIDGTLWVCGLNWQGQQLTGGFDDGYYAAHTAGGPFVDIAFGPAQHGLVLDAEGNVYSWGDNNNAQLGLGYVSPSGEDGLGYLSLIASNVKLIAVGDYQSFYVTNDDEVYGWGNGASMLNGDENGLGDIVLAQTLLLSGVGEIVNLWASYDVATVTTAAGNVHAWGGTKYDPTWLGSAGPHQIAAPPGVIKAARNSYATFMLTDLGELHANGAVQSGMAKVVDFALGWETGYALDENGDVWDVFEGAVTKVNIPKALRIGYSDAALVYLKESGTTGYLGSAGHSEDSPMFLGGGVRQFPRFYGWANQDMYSMADSSTDVTYGDGADGVGLGSNDGELTFYSSKGEVMLYIEGTADFEISSRFTSYRDAACTQVIEDINSFDNPELFEYSTDFAKWKPYPKAGLIPQGGETVRALLTVGPNRKVWIKSTIGAE